MGRRNNKNNQQQNSSGSPDNHPSTPSLLIIVALIGAMATIIAALIGIFGPIIIDNRHVSATQTADAMLRNISLTQTPTLPPFGEDVFEIDFSTEGEGNCNNYDPKVLGYDTSRRVYYIVPNTTYVAVCHTNDDLRPAGILQTTAFPDGDSSFFGYAVFFGWDGKDNKTTDACGFGIRKNKTKTEAIFIQSIRGEWGSPTLFDLNNFELDTNPHSIRMILYPSGKAVGYLDGNYIAEHSFVDCQSGPVGLIAYGPGEMRINFVNLKLFALP